MLIAADITFERWVSRDVEAIADRIAYRLPAREEAAAGRSHSHLRKAGRSHFSRGRLQLIDVDRLFQRLRRNMLAGLRLKTGLWIFFRLSRPSKAGVG